MTFETGNSQFDSLLRRARSKRLSADALSQNNIDVETISESVENQENNEDNNDRESVSDISGLGSSGVGSTEVSVTGISESISDASKMADVAGTGSGQSAGQMAFDMEKQRGIDDFAKNDPIGAAITGYYDSATQQSMLNLAPAALAYSGKLEAARAVGQFSNVVNSVAGTMISGIIGPSMDDPYGQTVAMGSGVFNRVSSSLMSTHYDVANKVSQGKEGYAQGYYGDSLVSVHPGFFGIGTVMSGVNVPSSSIDFMGKLDTIKKYDESVEPFGRVGSTNVISNPSAISVDTFDSATQAAQAGVGYSSYSPDGNPTGAAPAGSQYSSTGTFSTDSSDSGGPNASDSNSSNMGYGFKEGGKIGMAEGDVVQQSPEVVQGAGFIDQDRGATPQEEIKDDKPLEAEEGDFIINAPAAEFMGKQDVEEMISVAITNLQEKGVEVQFGNPEMNVKDNVQLLVSRNEVYIPKVIAEEIGYDKLEKINNRGKEEVSRRQQEAEQPQDIAPQQGLAEGGFINMQEGDVVTDDDGGMDIMEQMNPNTIKKIKGLMKRGINRGSIEALIDNLPDREALALTIFSESIVSKDSPDSMRAIGETVLNRVNDKTYSFKNQNTLKDVLKSRSNKGSGSKMFSYEGLEPKYLTPRLPEMLNNKYWQKALDAADNALDTEPDMEQYKLRDDVFTYGRVGEASARLKSNKRNEYLTTIGEHDFYSRTPEKGGRISSETMGESPEFYR